MAYTAETFYFDEPLFPHVSVTYVLTMVGSSRREQYMTQLQLYRPTSRVVILHNKGYKHGDKPDWVCSSAADLWHANTEVFRRERNTPYVLILEDDFVFTRHADKYAGSVYSFMEAHSDCTCYNFGVTPLLTNPLTGDHIRIYVSGSTHAVLWSNAGMRKFETFTLPKKSLHDFEVSKRSKTYMHKRPLAVQAHERTSNFKTWPWIARAYLFPWIMLTNVERDGRVFYEMHHLFARVGGIAPTIGLCILATIHSMRKKIPPHVSRWTSSYTAQVGPL